MMDAKEIGRLRGQARAKVIRDGSLSLGARLFYCYLDDEGRAVGQTPMLKQPTMAAMLAASPRSITGWIQELEGKYIGHKRGQYGSSFTLGWIGSRSAKTADLTAADLQKMPICAAKTADLSDRTSHSPLTYKDSMYSNGRTEEAEAVAAVRSWLLAYPDASGLRGEPDAEICGQCIEIAGGNLYDLRQAIEEIYRKNHGRNKPTESWAWFPAVLRKMAGQQTAARAIA